MKKSQIAAALALVLSATVAQAETSDWKQVTDSGGLTYKIHVPTTFSKPVPEKRALMVVMTGCVQDNTAVTDSSTGSAANLEAAAANWGMVMVAPAKNSSTQAGFSCWGYWQDNTTQASIKAVRTLVSNLLKDPSLNVDPNQVYITGLSSGATVSVEIACGAPDLIAGVAPSAGPTMTTGSNCALNQTFCSVTQSAFTQQCNAYATTYGADKNLFKTQIASVGYGTSDTTVSTKYGLQNANLLAGFYGSYTGKTYTQGSTANNLAGGQGASEWQWNSSAEKRVSLVAFNTVPHAWSAGAGAKSTSYVSSASINYADYLGKFFTENNLRVVVGDPNVVSKLACSVGKDSINLTWTAPKNGADSYIARNLTSGENTETTALNKVFQPLTTGTAYRVTVAAKRGGTMYADATPIICTPTPVAAPTDLVATPSATTVALTWKGAAAKYNITRNAAAIGSSTTTNYTDTGLAPVTNYNYCVKAVDVNGDESAATCVATTTKPAICYTTTAAGTCSDHYVAKRLDLNKYLACGNKYGYMASVTLYGYGSPTVWTDKPDCSPM